MLQTKDRKSQVYAVRRVRDAVESHAAEVDAELERLLTELARLRGRASDQWISACGIGSDDSGASSLKEHIEALMLLGEPFTLMYSLWVVDLAAKHGLSAMYGLREFVGAEGLMACG